MRSFWRFTHWPMSQQRRWLHHDIPVIVCGFALYCIHIYEQDVDHADDQLLSEDHTAVFPWLQWPQCWAITSEVNDGSVPPWHPDDGYASQVLSDFISSRSALPEMTHVQFIVHSDIEP